MNTIKKPIVFCVLVVVLLALFALFVLGIGGSRGSSPEISRESTGKILRSYPISASLLSWAKTVIETERANIVIVGLPIVHIGSEGFLIHHKNEWNSFTWKETPYLYNVCR